MPSITFIPDNREEKTEQDETILETAQRTNIPLTHVCVGDARCSTCCVQIIEGHENVSPRSRLEQDIADQMNFDKDIRLAHTIKIRGKAGLHTVYEVVELA